MKNLFIAFYAVVLIAFAFIGGAKFDTGQNYKYVLILSCASGVIFCLDAILNKRKISALHLILWIIFIASAISAWIFSPIKNYGFSELLMIANAGIIFFTISTYADPQVKKYFYGFLLLFGCVCALVGFYNYISYPLPRAFGIFYNHSNLNDNYPNAMGTFLLTILPIAFLYLRKKPYIFVASLALIIPAIVFTLSRAAFITISLECVILIAYFLIKNKTRIKTIGILALTTVLIFGVVLGINHLRGLSHDVYSIVDRAQFSNFEKLTSYEERIDIWNAAISLIKEKPIIGWGSQNFRFLFPALQSHPLESTDHAHNIILKFWLEYGLAAVLAGLAFIIFLIIKFAKTFIRTPQEKQDVLAILAIASAGGIIHSMVDYNFNFVLNLILSAGILGLFVSNLAPYKFTFTAPAANLFTNRILILLAAALIFFPIYEYKTHSLQPAEYFARQADAAFISKDYDKALELAEKHASLNPYDAIMQDNLGRIFYAKGDKSSALEHFKKAILLDPINTWKYHYHFLRSLNESAIKPDEIYLKKLQKFISDYVFYADNNIHFTSFTDNIEFASASLDELKKIIPAQTENLAEIQKNLQNDAYKYRNSLRPELLNKYKIY